MRVKQQRIQNPQAAWSDREGSERGICQHSVLCLAAISTVSYYNLPRKPIVPSTQDVLCALCPRICEHCVKNNPIQPFFLNHKTKVILLFRIFDARSFLVLTWLCPVNQVSSLQMWTLRYGLLECCKYWLEVIIFPLFIFFTFFTPVIWNFPHQKGHF